MVPILPPWPLSNHHSDIIEHRVGERWGPSGAMWGPPAHLLTMALKSSDVSRCHFFFFFLSVISLCWGKDYSLAVGSKGYSLVAVHRLLAAMAPFVENGLSVTRASVIAAPGLQSPSSVVVAKGLSCFTACEIFLDQWLNLCLLHWQVDSLPLRHQGSP